MVIASVGTALNFFLICRQMKQKNKIHTTNNLIQISKTVSDFWEASRDIKPYTTETEQWYTETVIPYLSFLLWLYANLNYKLFSVKVMKLFTPQLAQNYERILPYLKYQREDDPEAWVEVEKLNEKLGIEIKK